MSGKTWSIANTVITTAAGVLGLVGIVTGMKSAEYDANKQYEELEERYGLVPVPKIENKETE